MRKIASLLLLALIGCTTQNPKKMIHDNVQTGVLNSRLFDSVQVFVKENLNNNYLSQHHLLSLESYYKDSFALILTSITKEETYNKYKEFHYLNNKIDTSILILNDQYNLLFEGRKLPVVSNLFNSNMDMAQNSVTLNPLIWKLIVTKDTILIDKFYGKKEAETQVLIPKNKFKVPND